MSAEYILQKEDDNIIVIPLHLTDEEYDIVKAIANKYGVSIAELVRRSVLERIEDESDLQTYEKAKKDYLNDPAIYTHDEIIKMFTDEDIFTTNTSVSQHTQERQSIKELFANYNGEYEPQEIDWGESKGNEAT